jgi:hypothetical protein
VLMVLSCSSFILIESQSHSCVFCSGILRSSLTTGPCRVLSGLVDENFVEKNGGNILMRVKMHIKLSMAAILL